jgi:hypothetical protein
VQYCSVRLSDLWLTYRPRCCRRLLASPRPQTIRTTRYSRTRQALCN